MKAKYLVALGAAGLIITAIFLLREEKSPPLSPEPILHRKIAREVFQPSTYRPPDKITPRSAGVREGVKPTDFPQLLRTQIAKGDMDAIQVTAYSWYEKDPAAARAWLESQETFADLQPAIGYIASRIAETGDTTNALKWSALIENQDLRNETALSIYVAALAQQKITIEEIPETALPPALYEALVSGAAGD